MNTALIQTARDKAVEILKSFRERKKKDSILKLKSISIRFDKRCYTFSRTTNVLTPYWLTLSLNGRNRVSLPIMFGERQKERIEEAFSGEWGSCDTPEPAHEVEGEKPQLNTRTSATLSKGSPTL